MMTGFDNKKFGCRNSGCGQTKTIESFLFVSFLLFFILIRFVCINSLNCLHSIESHYTQNWLREQQKYTHKWVFLLLKIFIYLCLLINLKFIICLFIFFFRFYKSFFSVWFFGLIWNVWNEFVKQLFFCLKKKKLIKCINIITCVRRNA